MTQDPVPIDANHSDVAKFGSASQHPFVQIATELSEISHRALQDPRPNSQLSVSNNHPGKKLPIK